MVPGSRLNCVATAQRQYGRCRNRDGRALSGCVVVTRSTWHQSPPFCQCFGLGRNFPRAAVAEFTLTAVGARRVRFAVSPLEELLAALRIGLGPCGHPSGAAGSIRQLNALNADGLRPTLAVHAVCRPVSW
jgi:hypothetical protein